MKNFPWKSVFFPNKSIRVVNLCISATLQTSKYFYRSQINFSLLFVCVCDEWDCSSFSFFFKYFIFYRYKKKVRRVGGGDGFFYSWVIARKPFMNARTLRSAMRFSTLQSRLLFIVAEKSSISGNRIVKDYMTRE